MTTDTTSTPNPTQEDAEQAVDALWRALADPTKNLITRLKVTQYVEWRARFDDMRASSSASVTNAKVFYDIENETDLAILADVADLASAEAWAQGGWRSHSCRRSGSAAGRTEFRG